MLKVPDPWKTGRRVAFWSILVSACLAASNLRGGWLAGSTSVFAIGLGGALGPLLQTRLMDVAGKAQTLAAALNHSAFNVANALGPFLGGIAIAHGYGLASTGLVGSGLALAGLAILLVAVRN